MRNPARRSAARERWAEAAAGAAIKSNSVSFIAVILSIVFLSAYSPTESAGAASEQIELPKEAVSKKILENGLTILAKGTRAGDPVSIYVKIGAGSSLEEEYLGSGMSHLVEHMVFKGTAARGVGAVEKETRSYGGVINGSVGQDITDFHITVPAQYFPQAVSIIKDMLLNAKFDNDEFIKEKDVILKEIRLDNDEPQNKIFRLLNQAAYLCHTYKYPAIGYTERFNQLTRDDAVKYYNRMYAPNRMVIAVVGGVEPSAAIEAVTGEFKDFRPPNYSVIGLSGPEPTQIGKRSAETEADIHLAYLAIGFHSTSILDEDLFAMDVLAMILGRGDNSTLNRILVKEKRLAHAVSCWNYTPREPGLFVISATLDNDNMDGVEKSAADQIKVMQDGNITDAELESAKRMVLADFIFGLQTTDEQANDIAADYLLTGNYDFSRRYVSGVQAVSKEDIKRVANKYLRPDSATTVKLVPAGAKKISATAGSEAEEDIIRKVKLADGLTVLVRENRKMPAVSITVAMLGGLMTENNSNNGIANLVANMLLKGTGSRKEAEIAGAVESRGGSLAAFSGFNSFGLNMELLKADLDEGLALLKEILTDSNFPQEEIEKAKTQVLAAIKGEDDDIFQRGLNSLRGELFAGSPYAFRYLGTVDTIIPLTRDDFLSYYKKYCVPDNMVISISGDVAPDKVVSSLEALFKDVKGKKPDIPPVAPAKIDSVKPNSFEMGREESLVMFGFRSAGVKDEDRYPVEVLTAIMSGEGGRLFNSLRDKESLAYTLGCAQKLALDTGFTLFYVATEKNKLQHSKEALAGEILDIRDNLAQDEELAAAKKELIGRRKIAMQTNSFYAGTSAMDELYGLGYDDLYKYQEKIEKVTKEDIKRVADKYFDMKACAEVSISSK